MDSGTAGFEHFWHKPFCFCRNCHLRCRETDNSLTCSTIRFFACVRRAVFYSAAPRGCTRPFNEMILPADVFGGSRTRQLISRRSLDAGGRHTCGGAALDFQSWSSPRRPNNAPKVQELPDPPPLFEVPTAHPQPPHLAGWILTSAAFSSAGTASKIATPPVIPKIAASKADFMWVNLHVRLVLQFLTSF